MNFLNSKISKWFFYKYFGIPKDVEIFKLQKTSIHYWKDKKNRIAICKEFGQPLMRIKPLVGFLSEPERGATDTASVNNKDCYINNYPGYEYDNANNTELYIYASIGSPNYVYRTPIHFTLSAGSGTISDVKLYLYSHTAYASATSNVHQITQTAWTETGANWYKYDGTNTWATAGGDFSATVIDAITIGDATGWKNWVLMGTGSDNPLTLTWSNNVHLMLKVDSETSGSTRGGAFRSRDYTTDPGLRPYLEITYSVPSTANPAFLLNFC